MNDTTPKYPQVTVALDGEDGNAFDIIGRCCRAARKAGLEDAEIQAFRAEAMSGNYDQLLQTCMKWFDAV